MNDMDDACATIINTSTDKVSEVLFKNKYLPLLLHPNPAAFNCTWLNEVAKSPHVRVYVIGDAGEVLFSVPPLRSAPFSDNPGELVQVLTYIQLQSNMVPSRGNALLAVNLPKLINVVTDNSTYIEEWRAIFDRYGLTNEYITQDNIADSGDYTELLDSDDGWN